VFCSNDMTAIGAMRGAFELGLNVPRDLSVVGFDDIQMAQFATPPLTTVQMSYVEIANAAFKALLDSAEPQCNRPSPQVYAIKTNLVLRHSTALAHGRLKEAVARKHGNEQAGTAELESCVHRT
jgi:DNA-binding LacI/PurR family transcriptional regulator